MWCTHCVEDQQVAWGPDYIACSVCGKLFEFPVSKSHRMIGKPKKFQEKKHKHPIDNMSSTSTKSHGQELKRKEKKHKHPTNNVSSTSTKSHGQMLKRKAVLATQLFCWTGQFIGHGVFEKRAPALLDNLSQAFLMAPFFVLLELLQSLFGYEPYPGFHANVLKKIEVDREQWQARKHK